MNAWVLGIGGLLGYWEVNSERRDCSRVWRSVCCGGCSAGFVGVSLAAMVWLRARAGGIFVCGLLLGGVEKGQVSVGGLSSR